MSGYDQSDAAKDTGVKESEAAQAHHDARDDAEVRGSGEERSKEETPTKANQAEAQAAESKFGLGE